MPEEKDEDDILNEMEQQPDPDEEVLEEMEDGETAEEDEVEEKDEEPAEKSGEKEENSGETGKDEPEQEKTDEEKEKTAEERRLADRKLGELTIDLDKNSSSEDTMVYHVEAEVKGQKQVFQLPRYDTHLGWIETFGVPPFNQWVILRDFEYMNKNFSGSLGDKKYSESIEIEEKGVSGYRVNLQRTSGNEEEYYNTRITNIPGEKGRISLTECISSKGVYTDTIHEKSYRHTGPKGIPGLIDYEREYLDKIVEEEGDPDVIKIKQAEIDGPIPAIYRTLFPFWETEKFDEKPLRAIEIGYLDRGDNSEDIDKKHGDWFKLFSFKGFDYSFLEIREGGWKSTGIEFEGEEVTTKQHYEKKMYEYEPEVEEDGRNKD